MKLYLKTTKDKYELPVAVAASTQELARMLGMKNSSVKSHISHHDKGWLKIEFEDEERGTNGKSTNYNDHIDISVGDVCKRTG